MRFSSLLLLSGLSAAGTIATAQTAPQQGLWRGIFALANGQEAPFNFELKDQTAYLLNGSERFELKGITTRNDSVFIPVDIYDATLAARIVNGKTLSGAFKRNGATDQGIPFSAEAGKKYRFFEQPVQAGVSLHGKWDVLIGKGGNKTVGVFEQHGSKLTGTFLTTTGDYRYFEGSVRGDEFFLSAFSGSNPSLVKGKISGNTLTGEIINAARQSTG